MLEVHLRAQMEAQNMCNPQESPTLSPPDLDRLMNRHI